jgi:hypothetical protein
VLRAAGRRDGSAVPALLARTARPSITPLAALQDSISTLPRAAPLSVNLPRGPDENSLSLPLTARSLA